MTTHSLFPSSGHDPLALSATEPVLVSTDGACLKNPGGPSGWAWYASDNCWAAGGFDVGTNQQAELLAMLAVLTQVPHHVPLRILTDSQYTLKACTVWMKGWKAKGWKRADGQPVMNLDLMQALDRAMAARTAKFTIEWVKGHNANPMNENADYRCGNAARAAAQRKVIEVGPGWGDGPDGQVSMPPRRPSSGAAHRGRGRRR